MDIHIGGYVEKVNAKELSYSEFVKKYMEKNQPVVLTGLMDDWRSCSDWVNENGQPNLQFFCSHFGKSSVQVADCSTREFTDQKRVEMSVSEFIDRWIKDSLENHCIVSNDGATGKSLLYLKDWHFVKEYPNYVAYSTPQFFCDDWLNLYLDNYRMHNDPDAYQDNDEISCSDYRFVYIGAKGSWTPLHADVFRSYSWSANVCGKKRWLFLAPSQCHLVFDRNMKSCVYDIFDDVSETKYPGFKRTIWLDCIQEHNEIIFVPSGWYHQVFNLEDTISINHNWFNGYNLSWVLDLLMGDYNEAKEYIEDIRDICDDFESLCQRNLAANTGMNFGDFFIFIARFAFANLVQLGYLARNYEYGNLSSSPIAQHLVLNLECIQKIATKMKSLEGLSENQGFILDLREALVDTQFLKLCEVLGKTYGIVHKQRILSLDGNNDLVDNLGDLNFIRTSRVSTPEDLVNIIGSTLAKFRTV